VTHEQMNILNPFKCCALNPNVYTVGLWCSIALTYFVWLLVRSAAVWADVRFYTCSRHVSISGWTNALAAKRNFLTADVCGTVRIVYRIETGYPSVDVISSTHEVMK